MRRRMLPLAGWILVVALIDQGTAWGARHALAARSLPIWGQHFQLRLLYNKGALLGLGSHEPLLITVVGVIGTALLAIATFRLSEGQWALATLTGGALGNVMSRLVFSKVTDFLYVQGYPGIFNLSDVALRLGLIWFLVDMLVTQSKKRRCAHAG